MNNKNNYSSFFILNILLFVLFLELVFPPVTVIGNSTWICALCLAGWLGLSFMFSPQFYMDLNIKRAYLLIFLVASVVFPYIMGQSVFGNRYVSLGLIPVGPIIFDYYKAHGKLGDLKKIVLGIVPFAAITFFITFTKLSTDSYISRSIKSSGEYSKELAREGIGGYSFIYFMVVVSVLLLYISLKANKKILKILNIVGFVLSIFFLLKANYVTALLVALLASIVLIIMHYADSNTNNMPALIISVLAVFFIIANLNTIISSVSEYIPARIASVLITEDNKSVFQAVADEFLDDRWPVMKTSIEGFFENLIFGYVGAQDVSVINSFSSGFGQHSHILDTFSLLGVIFGVVNIFVILKPFKDDYGVWIKKERPLNVAILICVIGIYLFNNATASVALAVTIIFPLVREMYSSDDRVENIKNNE